MTVLFADFIVVYSEFAAVDSVAGQYQLDAAERRTNRSAWDTRADDGIMLLAAHMLTLRQRAIDGAAGGSTGTITGPLQSETVGPLSRSYAAVSVSNGSGGAPWSDAWFSLTSYGVEYIAMRSTIFADRTLVDERCWY